MTIALDSAPTPRGKLLRAFGVVFGLAVIVGNTIAAGILATPGDIAARLPTPTLFFGVWVAGALYALLGALNLAELGAMIQRSGGQYVFARHAFGPYTGFIIGWSDWLSTSASTAAVSFVLAESVATLVPALAPYKKAVAAAAVIVFTLVIWRGARESGRAQTVTSLLKALALLVLVVTCLLAPRGAPSTATVVVPVGATLFGAIVLAMQGVIYTYDGWNGVLYFSEEVQDPGRDIPRAMLGGVLSVAAIYLLLNIAFAWVLTVPRMGGEPLVAAAAARAMFGGRAYAVVSALTIVMLLSAVNALLLMGSRVPVAMSRDGLFPASAANVDAKGTPTVALLLTTGASLMFIITGAFNAVLALAAFYFVLQYLVSFSALVYLRRKEPDAPRPYRAWGYPWTTGLVLIGSIAFLAGAVASDRAHSLWAFLLLLASYPVYRITRVARP